MLAVVEDKQTFNFFRTCQIFSCLKIKNYVMNKFIYAKKARRKKND